MTQEALKLALEALEEAWYHVGTFQPTEKAIDLYDEARTAIKKALAQTQEPVAWMWDVNNGAGYSSRGIGFYQTDIPFAKHTPLYTTPPQRTEQNFCSRCGKRTADLTTIHTCTPPQENT